MALTGNTGKKQLTYLLLLVTMYYYKWGQLQITKLNNWQIKAKHSESLRKYEELAKVCVCVYRNG